MTKKKYPGYLMVANPNNPRDEISKSTILVVTHNSKLAIGLQLNNPLEDINLKTVADNIELEYEGTDPLFYGGNISQNKIHVVHSNDWCGLSTVKLNEHLSVTNDISVLCAIAGGEGPEYFRACAGYWIWEDGKLDAMLDPHNKHEPHKWVMVPATLENSFSGEGPEQWRLALEQAARYQVSAWF